MDCLRQHSLVCSISTLMVDLVLVNMGLTSASSQLRLVRVIENRKMWKVNCSVLKWVKSLR